MENVSSYSRSDLAYEKRTTLESTDIEWQRAHGIEYSEICESGISIATLEIKSEEGASLMGKPQGKYITVFCGKIWLLDDDTLDTLSSVIAKNIRALICEMLGREIDAELNVLVVGLGNRQITPDAIGPDTVENIYVTRHLKYADYETYKHLNLCNVSALVPGVLGQTGIETVELVRGAAENAKPSIIIVIDALVARSCERLATTVQLSDTGINPGSGVGNNRKSIDKSTIGIPVLSIGVPTVVDSSTLVYDALEKSGISDISDELKAVLENGRGFFVSPKETDVITDEVSKLLSASINAAMQL